MGLTDDPGSKLIRELVELVKEISALAECRTLFKRMHGDSVRRIKLLSPLFEELTDGDVELREEEILGFQKLRTALESAKEFLRWVSEGSKLHQALQRDTIADKFQKVTVEIEAALARVSYDKLEISEEVREQIELVHAQFQRAKDKAYTPDSQLDLDLAVVQNEREPDPAVLRRLSAELHLRTLNDLKNESLAIHELVLSTGQDPDDCVDKMSSLLKKLKDIPMIGNPESDASEESTKSFRHRSPIIPDDFRCPISLELMKDPVIVTTGQTYERSCIQKWLDAGHRTCPRTQQTLVQATLTPNYVLKSLISLWCETNGVEIPKPQGTSCRTRNSGSSCSECDRTAIFSLLEKLKDRNPERQRAAAGELRLLAKRNADNRVCIAEAGAIPVFVELLSSTDPRTQEHAVTALLNLSINDTNKGMIVNTGAIPDIVEVLKNGSMEARENAAATLFSLSVIEENKVAIGAAGAIQALIDLLSEGSPRGKKDAATAIFNLCIYQGNKARAIRAGIVGPLLRLLKDPGGGMVDESLAILAILSTHQEAKFVLGQAEAVSVVVEIIRTGSPRNRENAAVVLWSLCAGNPEQLRLAREAGAEEAVKELSENGTDRAKRKAGSLLELIRAEVPT